MGMDEHALTSKKHGVKRHLDRCSMPKEELLPASKSPGSISQFGYKRRHLENAPSTSNSLISTNSPTKKLLLDEASDESDLEKPDIETLINGACNGGYKNIPKILEYYEIYEPNSPINYIKKIIWQHIAALKNIVTSFLPPIGESDPVEESKQLLQNIKDRIKTPEADQLSGFLKKLIDSNICQEQDIENILNYIQGNPDKDDPENINDLISDVCNGNYSKILKILEYYQQQEPISSADYIKKLVWYHIAKIRQIPSIFFRKFSFFDSDSELVQASKNLLKDMADYGIEKSNRYNKNSIENSIDVSNVFLQILDFKICGSRDIINALNSDFLGPAIENWTIPCLWGLEKNRTITGNEQYQHVVDTSENFFYINLDKFPLTSLIDDEIVEKNSGVQ